MSKDNNKSNSEASSSSPSGGLMFRYAAAGAHQVISYLDDGEGAAHAFVKAGDVAVNGKNAHKCRKK